MSDDFATREDFERMLAKHKAKQHKANPEQHVMDEIDELINAGLDDNGVPLDDYNADRYVECELCQAHWHGLPKASGCPGAYATVKQKHDWYSKSVEPQQECQTRVEVFFTDRAGHMARGELVLTNSNDGMQTYTLFIPSESDQPRGMTADLYTFDEARELTVQLFPDIPEASYHYVPLDDSPITGQDDTP